MSSTTGFAHLPLYDPNGADNAVNGLDYFNALTNANGSAMTIIDEHLEGLTSGKQDVIQCSTLPQVTAADNGKIVQYVGVDNASATPALITGHWYQVVSGAWQEIVYGDPNSVSYSAQAGRSDADKEQARNNIAAQQETSALAEENALDDNYYIPVYDTSASKNRKTLWSNIKSKLKSYFDGLYVPDTRTINEKLLDANIVLDAEDVGAATDTHTHGNIANNGSIGTEPNLPIFTGIDGVLCAIDPYVARHYLGAASNPNLLDNWYFAGAQISNGMQTGGFPINQRGKASYNNPTDGSYCIDRWVSHFGNRVVQITSNGLNAPNVTTESYVDIYQRIPEEIKAAITGKRVTLTILLSNGHILSGSFVYGIGGVDLPVSEKGAGIFCVSDAGYAFIIRFYDPSVIVIAAKLELGDKQTLARQENGAWVLNDPPPDYGQELAKCQRYLWPLRRYAYYVGLNEGTNDPVTGAAIDRDILFTVECPLRHDDNLPNLINPNNANFAVFVNGNVTGSNELLVNAHVPSGVRLVLKNLGVASIKWHVGLVEKSTDHPVFLSKEL